jgi:hypothetical protein
MAMERRRSRSGITMLKNEKSAGNSQNALQQVKMQTN